MAAVNKVILIGNIGADPELRRTQGGAAVVNFSIATTEKFKGKDGVAKEETEWHNIVAWNRAAEIMDQYLKKGSSVYLEGKLRTRSWEDNSVKKYKTEVLVSNFQFLGSKSGSSTGGSNDFGEAPFDSGFDVEQHPEFVNNAPAQDKFNG